MIAKSPDPAGLSAVRTAVYCLTALQAMSDDFGSAMSTFWRENVDRTFKTIENVLFLSGHHYFERLFIIVAAIFTFHNLPPRE